MEVEVVQLSCVGFVDRPRFTDIEEGGENYGPVNLDLSLYGDVSSVPYVLVECAENDTCFSKSGNCYIISDVSRECAAKVGELVHRVQSIVMLGSAYVFPRSGWYITSVFFMLIETSELLQASTNLSMLCGMSASEAALRTQLSAHRKSLAVSDAALVFA